MSRPEHLPAVAVDFAPPSRSRQRTRPVLALVIVMVLLGALVVAVTQLLLR